VTDPEGDATSDQHTTFVCPGKILPVIMFGKLLQPEAVFFTQKCTEKRWQPGGGGEASYRA